jgi:hypothetical protein
MDTHEFTFPGGSAIITTTTGGTKDEPDFCVSGPGEEVFKGRAVSVFAAEILRLAGFKATLEQVALALGCLPTQFSDAYGHVLEKAQGLAGRVRALTQESFDRQALAFSWMRSHDALLSWCQNNADLKALAAADLPPLPSPEGVAELWRLAGRVATLEADARTLTETNRMLGEENRNLKEDQERFVMKLLGELGLDLEAVDRAIDPVGNVILAEVKEKVGRLTHRLEIMEREREHFFRENVKLRTQVAELRAAWDTVVGKIRVTPKMFARLQALDALLAREEAPEGLADRLRTARDEDVLVPSFAGQARIAWRWFRERLGVEIGEPLVGAVAEAPLDEPGDETRWRPSWEEEANFPIDPPSSNENGFQVEAKARAAQDVRDINYAQDWTRRFIEQAQEPVRRENAALLEILREVEHGGEGGQCPICGVGEHSAEGLSVTSCRLGLALAGKAAPSDEKAKILGYLETHARMSQPALAWYFRRAKEGIERGEHLADGFTFVMAPYAVVEEQERADKASREVLDGIVERKLASVPEKPTAVYETSGPEPTLAASEPSKPWFAGLKMEEVHAMIINGRAPGSGRPGGAVLVPEGFLNWLTSHRRSSE